jgi:hypothetical protein
MYFHLHDLPYFRDHLAEYLGPPRTVLPQNTINRDPAVTAALSETTAHRAFRNRCRVTRAMSSNPSNVE